MSPKQKQGGALKTTIHPPPSGRALRVNISFDRFHNGGKLRQRKSQESPPEVYNPSQPLVFTHHIKAIAAEGDGLLCTVEKGAQAYTAINTTYRKLIELLVEADNLSHEPEWEEVELRGIYALNVLLDKTICKMNEGGYDELPAISALRQEINSRTSYLTEQQKGTYKEKTASHLRKVMQQKSQHTEKGH